MKRVRVLVVDDSPTMRSIISAMLGRDPDIEIAGHAGDPLEARAAIKALDPDVITLDIEMPNMNGVEFLERLMRLRPMPVIMVSTLTQEGAELTLAALELGAFDCVGKPVGGDSGYGFSDLAEKVKAAAASRPRVSDAVRAPERIADFRGNGRLVAIGASTGGVEALQTVLAEFPENCPPTVVTQHMPASFTRSFAERLNKMCAPEITEAEDGAPVEPGRVYIAPGGDYHLSVTGSGRRVCRLLASGPVSGHRPSVDVLFSSVAEAAGAAAVGALLTGMGRDGAQGLLAMRQAGARTLGQDEDSCVVYGMPRAAWEVGAVERQVPLPRMALAILGLCAAGEREVV